MLKNKFVYILGLSALILASTAAYFSITGLALLFSGAYYPVIIMMSGLELAKLITASYLYRYWKEIEWTLKTFLVIGVITIMLITSCGIYGFLSSAYSVTANKMNQLDGKTQLLEKQKHIIEQQIERQKEIVKNKSERITSLTTLRKDQESRIDTLYKKNNVSGVKRTEQSIKDADKQIEQFNKEIDEVNKIIQPNLDSVSKIELTILQLKSNDVSNEIGPLKYVAILTNKKIEQVVNFFIFLLIFVFDPLAVLLVIATNKVLVRESSLVQREFKEENRGFILSQEEIQKLIKKEVEFIKNVKIKEQPKFQSIKKPERVSDKRDLILKDYLQICKEASENEETFNKFKSLPHYKEVLEHTSINIGREYLKKIIKDNKWLLDIESVWDNDKHGNPQTEVFEFEDKSFICSPTTLQYLGIVSNLINTFKSLDGFNIIEIGGGYGGQCKVLQDVFEVNSYDIIDLHEAGMLQKKYLSTLNVKSFRTYSPSFKAEDNISYDLVISNYALSEVSEQDQLNYVLNVLLKSKHGYITGNQPLNGEQLLRKKFSTFNISKDIEGERETNYIITW